MYTSTKCYALLLIPVLFFMLATIGVDICLSQVVKIPLPSANLGYDGKKLSYVMGVGDFNGDGEYDYITRVWTEKIDPDRYDDLFKTITYAYLNNGTFLWELNHHMTPDDVTGSLNWTVTLSAWDMDGDGRDEVITQLKQNGVIKLVILDGMTGRIKKSCDLNHPRPRTNLQATIAYLDGWDKEPYIVIAYGDRSYNAITIAFDKNLVEHWRFDRSKYAPLSYWKKAYGWTNIYTFDLDLDHKDEIINGPLLIDDDGSLFLDGTQWVSPHIGSAERSHVADIIPSNPGYEWFLIRVGKDPKDEYYVQPNYWKGPYLIDIDQKKIIWHHNSRVSGQGWGRVHHGWVGEMDETLPGLEVWAKGNYLEGDEWQDILNGEYGDPPKPNSVHIPGYSEKWILYSADGTILKKRPGYYVGNPVYWDDDKNAEYYGYRWGNLFERFDGSVLKGGFAKMYGNGESTQADILGDWREEIIVSSEYTLYVYSNTSPTSFPNRPSFRTDHNYLMNLASIATGHPKTLMRDFWSEGTPSPPPSPEPTLPPVITSFTPLHGPVGTEVTINGQYIANTTQVTFNGVVAERIILDSDIQIRAIVPNGASTGRITLVTTAGTATSEEDFTVDPSPSEPDFIRRINAGGGYYRGNDGRVWSEDQAYFLGSWGYVNGRVYSQQRPIANTDDDVLYHSERYGMSTYRFTVPANGLYRVQLLFAEIYHNSPGKRLFNVYLEGNRILNNLDIYAEAGRNTALVKEFYVPVTDGVLDIRFEKVLDRPKVAAIEISTAETALTISQLAFTTNPRSAIVNTVTDMITIETQSENGIAVNVETNTMLNLSTTSSTGEFSLTQDPFSPITSLTIPAGSSTVSFYYRDGTVGSPMLTVEENPDQGWTDAQQQLTISEQLPAPIITDFSPQNGQIGIEVTIIGVNLSAATQVTFNNIVANNFTIDSDSLIRVIVPVGASTGKIEIVTPGGIAASANDFIVDSPTVESDYIRRVNAGGRGYQGTDGREWSADQAYSVGSWGYVGGRTFTTGDQIIGTDDDVLYRTERYGMPSYRFTVPVAGHYRVQLLFAEIFYKASDHRLFDVYLENQKVLSDLDIYSKTGHDAALVQTFDILVTDGILDVKFGKKRDRAKVSAIEVLLAESSLPSSLPMISGFTPPSGEIGTEVMIMGQFFTGATQVIFNGVASAYFTVDFDTLIRARVPNGAHTGKIQVVTTGGIATSQDDFIINSSPQETNYIRRVNVGGAYYQGADGREWLADQAYIEGSWGYVGGRTYTTSDQIRGTDDDVLYQSERYSMLSYRFTVPVVGSYHVQLLFAEIYYKSSGSRLFDVYLENKKVLTHFDAYSEAGHDAAIVRTFEVVVSDGVLDVKFVRDVDSPKISAIEVIERNAGNSLFKTLESEETELSKVANTFRLYQNYPNPFNPETEFQLEVPHSCHVSVKIYNQLGQEIKILLDEEKSQGIYRLRWDGRDQLGRNVGNGVYFYRMITDKFSETRKMILMR